MIRSNNVSHCVAMLYTEVEDRKQAEGDLCGSHSSVVHAQCVGIAVTGCWEVNSMLSCQCAVVTFERP